VPIFVPRTEAPTHLGAFRGIGPGALSNPIGGVPILPELFGPNARFAVQAAWGANLSGDPDAFPFVDITHDVLHPGDGSQPSISITPMGRNDEYSTAPPAACSFELKNLTGRYSKGPQSPLYPYIKEDVPIRVLLDIGNGASTEFFGYAEGFTPVADQTGAYNVVQVSATGSTRRLFQGTSPLRTAMARANLALSPGAYWECDSPSGSDRALSSVQGVDALLASGAVQFGSTALTLGGVGPFIDTRNGGMLTGVITTYAQFNPTSWTMEMVAGYGNTSPAGTPVAVQIGFTNGNMVGFVVATSLADGKPHHISFNLLQVGADIQTRIYFDGVFDHTVTTSSLTLSQPSIVTINPQGFGAANVDNPLINNLVFFPVLGSDSSLRARAAAGWLAESATDRLTRLCVEEGITLDLHGTSDVLMGAQAADTRLNLLRACEKADRGVLADGFGPGLSYWSHQARSQLVQSAAVSFVVGGAIGGELTSFKPIDDTQRRVNKFTMNRQGGGKGVFEDSTSAQGDGSNGIGQYESSDTVNVSSDSVLINQAAWRVREGTDPAPYRYPGISVNFANSRAALRAQAWLNAGLMSRIDALNPELYMQHPAGTVSSVLEGYSLFLGPRVFRADMNLGPAHPWDVDTLASNFILDTGGTVLADPVPQGGTNFDVIVTGKALWITSAAWPQDFPRWLDIGGYPIRLTAADAYSNSNPYFETDVSGWQVLAGSGTFTQSSTQAHQGTFSGLLTPDGVTAGPQVRTDEVVVNPGEFWTGEGWIFSTLGGTWSMFINWYDLSHTLITSATLASVILNGSQWTRFPISDPSIATATGVQLGALAPAGAVYARMGFIATGTPTNTNLTYFDQARFIGRRQKFTTDPVSTALPANTPVKVWRPAVLAL